MIKQLLHYLDYGFFAEAALAIFASVFLLIVAHTLRTASESTDRWSRIVLEDTGDQQP